MKRYTFGVVAFLLVTFRSCYVLPGAVIESVWAPENARVLGTAQISGSPQAYLFWYDVGATGYSVRMVSLEAPTHDRALIESDYMNGIRWTAPNTLVVQLWKDEYRIVHRRSDIVIVPQVIPE